MTAIGAAFGRVGNEREVVTELLRLMGHRGDQPAGAARHPLGALAATAYGWEAEAGVAGATAVATDHDVAVVADASLYYVEDLRRRLGQGTQERNPAALILAAYRQWGEWFWERIEGDFSCVVADARSGLVIAARDHVGRRPLHYTVDHDQLVVGSLARAVALVTAKELNALSVAAAVGGLLGGSMETGFAGVLPVPAGGAIVARGGVVSVRPWVAPRFKVGGRPRLAESGEALRGLLGAAVRERVVAPRTAVWLSGGADSTAVFAAGNASAQVGSLLAPVSITYPEGDPAREDDHIRATTSHWNARVTWIDSEGVELFEHLSTRVAVRDDPYAHTFEAMNLRLASTSASIGARVAFDGYGGDQLFHVSGVFLADYLARLKWRALRDAMREMEVNGVRSFVSAAVLPLFPDRIREWLDALRGRDANRGTMIRQSLPSWISEPWRRDEQLLRRAALEPSRRLLESPSGFESRWYVETPYFPRAAAWAAGLALQAGVVVRSPLLDRRVLDFAASRPLSERVSASDSKLLLKAAVQGLAPASVLAPRPFKTGIPRGYLARQMDRSFLPMFRQTFSSPSRLVHMGLIDQGKLEAAVDQVARVPDHITRVQLFLTLQAELWLRSIEKSCSVRK
ncbi:MAG: hypothetical protein IPK85_26505 [Gemmatimonadetes bacterium]|nr:hypothetical protein [Gemmatimonadota bacterium]